MSHRPTRGSLAYRHIIWPYISSFRRRSHSNRQKLQSSTTPLSFEAPPRGTPRMSACTLYFQKLELSLIVCVYLHWNLCSGQWAPKDASFLRQSAFWPFKVIQGRWFGTNRNRERACNFLLIRHCDYGSMLPFEFRAKVNHEETRVIGLSSIEDPMVVAWVVLTQCQRVTDRRTDRQTDRFTIASTVLCIASYADAV